ncbi:glycosyl hydrolase family 76-domain-containing protein, partial [Coniochaeta sp. 2T2.1]
MSYASWNDGVDPCAPGMTSRWWMSWQGQEPGIRRDDRGITGFREEKDASTRAQVTLASLVAVRDGDRDLDGGQFRVTRIMRWHSASCPVLRGERRRRRFLFMALFAILILGICLYTSCCPPCRQLTLVLGIKPVELIYTSQGQRAVVSKYLSITVYSIVNMVATHWGGLVARASMLASSGLVERADQATYTRNNIAAIKTLQSWYRSNTGLWDSTGWWNSANCLTVLADFASVDPADANGLNIPNIMKNTFTNAQKSTSAKFAQKSISEGGIVVSTYTVPSDVQANEFAALGFSGFINDYYDDEGWWALALLHSYDINHDPGFLDMAQRIFEDMKAGTDNTCGGGIWWSKDRNYKNAIANELYLSVAASLANRVPGKKSYYLDIAKREWTWFRNSGMINAQNNINDGLNINADGTCTNNGKTAWSYNQGVILGGLVELSKASGDSSFISQANTIATAAIKLLSDSSGVIHDGGCEPNCGGDGNQFKGIFMRNLGYLYEGSPQAAYKTSIEKNADAIWARDRNAANNQLGVVWTGPYTAGGGPTAATQSSALDALVAALRVA